MELSGKRTINASRDAVWAHLVDAETLKASIPGCQELTGDIESGFEAVVKQKIGPVRATFKGNVILSDIVEGQSYRISGKGSGGVAGFAKGGANVVLESISEGETELTYDVEAKVGGKIAQLGNRLISGFARKLADQFFEKFQAEVEGKPADDD